jgi:hypothetical protein
MTGKTELVEVWSLIITSISAIPIPIAIGTIGIMFLQGG